MYLALSLNFSKPKGKNGEKKNKPKPKTCSKWPFDGQYWLLTQMLLIWNEAKDEGENRALSQEAGVLHKSLWSYLSLDCVNYLY